MFRLRKVIDYSIVGSHYEKNLESQVRLLLKRGWTPHKKLFLIKKSEKFLYAREMVKYETNYKYIQNIVDYSIVASYNISDFQNTIQSLVKEGEWSIYKDLIMADDKYNNLYIRELVKYAN